LRRTSETGVFAQARPFAVAHLRSPNDGMGANNRRFRLMPRAEPGQFSTSEPGLA